jgi:hypothetical protein
MAGVSFLLPEGHYPRAIGAKDHPFAHFNLNQSFRANPAGNFFR